MSDNTNQQNDQTKQPSQQEQEKKHHEESATPIKPATDEVKAVPASESTKNSK
jgi:hypothetical protein